ncbi:LacI family DNA-binding transcriptional regulator [Thermoactinomyces daqus]|uniref:LacI family DNA-binding transcriptional regulator n=1 Tax=Thermoactinomyces daqus TaxID=1329516 RepID=A0A7W2AIK5_9BACL|nr:MULTISPECIES: LacI family DNA-binding transcriptional regulator [Thermoactinomyces]MBA4544347.1 LacI family DNA-binding transcriptional regulator [Thermoactinomyces daqus]MBH8605379.1 LacI family DNA-binding transcriptional regulator [Thermoactinomyces sp. CICC 10522]
MKVTIKDLARLAGVSITTVSRALNGYKDVRPETRRKILELAKELHYRPSGIARSLVTKESKTLGLIISGFTGSRKGHHFMFDIIYGVIDQATECGYDVILAATSPHQQKAVPYMELCQRRQLDGVIFFGARRNDVYLHEIINASVPCVLIDVPIVSDRCSFVTVDNRKAARLAVDHLLLQGHRRIAMINGHQEAYVSEEREAGFREALKQADLDEPLIVYGDFEEESGREGAKKLLETNPDLTAIFCASDWMAMGAVNGLRDLGKRVPEEVSVIGFDDIELCRYVTPALTTIHQPRYELGSKAAKELVALLRGEKGKGIVLEPELIIRNSTN